MIKIADLVRIVVVQKFLQNFDCCEYDKSCGDR